MYTMLAKITLYGQEGNIPKEKFLRRMSHIYMVERKLNLISPLFKLVALSLFHSF